ncbi:MAG TPA: transposase [Lacipirellulaceae bacterium]
MTRRRIPHRKRVRHYDEPGHCHELAFSCYARMPLLSNDVWRGLLSEAIDRAHAQHNYSLTAFVYMPEHVHLLAFPVPDASSIDSLIRAIKRPYSFRIKRLLEESRSLLLRRLTIRQRPGVETFRFWQEGPGYDRNLERPESALAAIHYIQLNPVRRGLVKRLIDWQWSSARWYEQLAYDANIRLPKLDKLPAEFLLQAAR